MEQKGTTNITICVPYSLKIAALRWTDELDINMSQWIRHLIRVELERVEAEKREKECLEEMRKESEQ